CTIVKDNSNIYASAKGFKLRIPFEQAKMVVKDYINKEAVLGVRPEHIDAKSTVRDYDPESIFEASVWVVEPVGSEKLAHIKVDQYTLVARLDPHVDIKPGQTVEFVAKMDLAHVFDKETERTVL
ncbi:unnamed protein product, partial [marine sediment metagenome]